MSHDYTHCRILESTGVNIICADQVGRVSKGSNLIFIWTFLYANLCQVFKGEQMNEQCIWIHDDGDMKFHAPWIYNLCYFIYLLCWATESESLACYACTTCNALSEIKEDQFRLVPGKTELILIAENIIVDGPDIYLFAHYFLHSFHRAQNWGRRL